jgi:hypothetical protein
MSLEKFYKKYPELGPFCCSISLEKAKIVKAFLIEFESEADKIIHLIPYLKKGLAEGFLITNMQKKRAQERFSRTQNIKESGNLNFKTDFEKQKTLVTAIKKVMEDTGPYYEKETKAQPASSLRVNHRIHPEDNICFISFDMDGKKYSTIFEYKQPNFVHLIKDYMERLAIPKNNDIIQLIEAIEGNSSWSH